MGNTGRVEKLEADFEEQRTTRQTAHEKLEEEFKTESEERKTGCAAITKKLGQEAAQWRSRCEKIERTVTDNKKMSDGVAVKHKERHEDLMAEVAKLQATLTNNKLAVDPFKHFSLVNLRDGGGTSSLAGDNDSIKLPKLD